MFMLPTCPYCQRAMQWMDEVRREHPEYSAVEVRMIDERANPQIAGRFDYYLVPTYYIGDEKVHEGGATKEIIGRIYQRALEM